MMRSGRFFLSVMVLLSVTGCATLPTGPSVVVLPAQGKPFEVFQAEESICRNWAGGQIGISPQEAAETSTATGAVIGTALGAGVGAVLGAASGHGGPGALIGAGSGLLLGTSVGADAGRVYGWEAQRRYDIAYLQCMYAKGNQIPATIKSSRRYQRTYPPPGYYRVPDVSYDSMTDEDWVPESYDSAPPPP